MTNKNSAKLVGNRIKNKLTLKNKENALNSAHSASSLRLSLTLAQRDFKTRYLGSLGGFYWVIVHPLTLVVIYTVIFSKMNRGYFQASGASISSSLYICAGVLCWNLHSDILNRCCNCFLENAAFIKKMPVPLLQFLFAGWLTAIFNFIIISVLFAIFSIMLGSFSLPSFLSYFLTSIFLSLFSFGVGCFLSVLNVFLRDVQNALSVFLQLGFWCTPIVYHLEILPNWAKDIVKLNPYFYLTELSRNKFFQVLPSYWINTIAATAISLVAVLLGAFFVKKLTSRVRDEL
jgi:lipopolysaccharide transport system permease protein